MEKQLKQSMKPTASFTFLNKAAVERVLCLFPGHFDTTEIVKVDDKVSLAYCNPKPLVEAGYYCDQVADDYSAEHSTAKLEGSYDVQINPVSKRTRYREFLNFIKTSGLRVSKMRITDLNSEGTHEIFNQELEISASAIGAKAGSDFLQLSAHIDPSNYIQRFIDIDLSQQNLLLDETTLAFLRVPAKANFQIDFTLG